MYEGVVSDADVLGCGFCDALRGRVRDARLALNDERFAVSMGQYQPTGPGYAFVVPHAHIQDLHSLPEHECGPMLQMVQRTSVANQRTFGVSGTTVVQNNGLPGQSVPHLHFHIVPVMLAMATRDARKCLSLTTNDWTNHGCWPPPYARTVHSTPAPRNSRRRLVNHRRCMSW